MKPTSPQPSPQSLYGQQAAYYGQSSRNLPAIFKWIGVAVCCCFISTSFYHFSLATDARGFRTARQAVKHFAGPSLAFEQLYPLGEDVTNWPLAARHNQKTASALLECLARENCAPNQAKVIIAASFHWRTENNYWRGGETIWLESLSQSFEELGYSVFYACDASFDFTEAMIYWRLFRHITKVIFAEPSQIQQCIGNAACIKSEANPTGIPIWQMLAFNIWPGPAHELGANWTIGIDNLPDSQNRYLGYSLEKSCRKPGLIPFDERSDKAFAFGKDIRYFNERDFAWSLDDFAYLSRELHLNLVGGYSVAPGTNISTIHVPPEIENLGFLAKDDFLKEIGSSKVLIGIGNPLISPTPHDALCLGVPFINPILAWDPENPEDRTHWITQHNGLLEAEPPHVYYVHRGDSEAFRRAMRTALSTPIGSYIYPPMKMSALNARMEALVDFDWRGAAKDILPSIDGGEKWML